jgi:class 3 adenylate cyclase/Flp pilus assembly protein TadD
MNLLFFYTIRFPRRFIACLSSVYFLLLATTLAAVVLLAAPSVCAKPLGIEPHWAMQQNLDSLTLLLGKVSAEHRNDTITVNILNTLAQEYRSRNADSALKYAHKALEHSEKIDFRKGLGAALVNLGNIYRNLGDYNRALGFLQRALSVGEQAQNNTLIGQAWNGIGIVYVRQGNLDRALDALLKALRISEQLGDARGAASALDNLGIVHIRQGNTERAFQALFRALHLADSTHDKRLLSIVLNDLGIAYRTEQRFDSALVFYERSLRLKEELHDKQGSALALNGLGVIYRQQAKYDGALAFFSRAFALQEELAFQPGIATALSDIAQTYFKQRNYKESILYAERCITVARGIGAKVDLRNAYQTLADVHEAQGNQNLSYVYFRLYTAMKDSIFNEEVARKTADLNSRYEQEAQAQRIRLLEREKQVQSLELQRTNLIIYGLCALGALTIALIGALWGRIRYRKVAEAELNKKNRELAAAHEESEQLLRNTLPAPIVLRLKRGEGVIADRYDSVTVLFADIVGFSALAAALSPEELITLLDSIFSDIDAIATTNGLEKIKTVGDSYMLVGGAPERSEDHCSRVAKAAFAIQSAVARTAEGMGITMNVRIGMHTGAVVAGVIGTKKFAYDLWGDTVNIASRMEFHGEAGKIHCTEAIYDALTAFPQAGNDSQNNQMTTYTFEKREPIEVKGKGLMQTYFLVQSEQNA